MNKEKTLIKKYRKKPVVIEAIQFTIDNVNEILKFCKNICIESIIKGGADYSNAMLHIRTLEGTMIVSLNDYIIKGINGEFYPCKPDIFEKTYEEVL